MESGEIGLEPKGACTSLRCNISKAIRDSNVLDRGCKKGLPLQLASRILDPTSLRRQQQGEIAGHAGRRELLGAQRPAAQPKRSPSAKRAVAPLHPTPASLGRLHASHHHALTCRRSELVPASWVQARDDAGGAVWPLRRLLSAPGRQGSGKLCLV